MTAYLSRSELRVVAEDGRTVTVEAGDYLDGVDPFAGLTLRDRARWASLVRGYAEQIMPAEGLVVVDHLGRYALCREADLLPIHQE